MNGGFFVRFLNYSEDSSNYGTKMGLFEDVKTHLCGKKAARSEMKQKNCNNITKIMEQNVTNYRIFQNITFHIDMLFQK
jgi:hypothetical protein